MSDALAMAMQALGGKSPATVRLLRAGEPLPATLELGFDQLHALDPAWCWVIERDGAVRGCLLASPCHGTAMIWRLSITPGEPLSSLTRLLRTFLRDARTRGLRGYLTLVDEQVCAQAKLKRVIERAGGKTVNEHSWTLLAAPLPERSW